MISIPALSMGASLYVRLITGLPYSDPTGGYKCFRRRALSSLDLDAVRSNGYSFQIELTHKIWRQGMRIAEVPIILLSAALLPGMEPPLPRLTLVPKPFDLPALLALVDHLLREETTG